MQSAGSRLVQPPRDEVCQRQRQRHQCRGCRSHSRRHSAARSTAHRRPGSAVGSTAVLAAGPGPSISSHRSCRVRTRRRRSRVARCRRSPHCSRSQRVRREDDAGAIAHSAAIRAAGSSLRTASMQASEMRSHSLSGWPIVTDFGGEDRLRAHAGRLPLASAAIGGQGSSSRSLRLRPRAPAAPPSAHRSEVRAAGARGQKLGSRLKRGREGDAAIEPWPGRVVWRFLGQSVRLRARREKRAATGPSSGCEGGGRAGGAQRPAGEGRRLITASFRQYPVVVARLHDVGLGVVRGRSRTSVWAAQAPERSPGTRPSPDFSHRSWSGVSGAGLAEKRSRHHRYLVSEALVATR